MPALKTYRAKRDFKKTPEPRGAARAARGHQYVIQKHAARSLHYDLRLELDGVMLSWAVAKGPSLVPGEKRLAIHVEDHPIEYNKFEGTIPKGGYGGGTVMIWDRGTWSPEGDPRVGLKNGHLDFTLEGEKLKGRWHLVRMKKRPGERQESWLLIKSDDEATRGPRDPDILEEKPLSIVTGRSIDEIATAADKQWHSDRPAKGQAKQAALRQKAARKTRAAQPAKKPARSAPQATGVKLTHPDRVYWEDAGITKQNLADYYTRIWDWIAPHLVDRLVALLRCPEGATSQCFFQKHASAGIDAKYLRLVPDKGNESFIAVPDLNGLIALVQAGVLEIHAWGTTADALDTCDRLVFDLDPGPEVAWPTVIAGAREVRKRLAEFDLESFLKTTGGKGLHVVVPIAPADWDSAKDFAHQVALDMAREAPDRYTANMAKRTRVGRIFVDYLRNARGATAIAPYSTRARPGATVSTPLSWEEAGSLSAPNTYTVFNLPNRLDRLRRDPWADIGRIKQRLPGKLARRG